MTHRLFRARTDPVFEHECRQQFRILRQNGYWILYSGFVVFQLAAKRPAGAAKAIDGTVCVGFHPEARKLPDAFEGKRQHRLPGACGRDGQGCRMS